MKSAKLPHYSQSQLLVAVTNIFGTNTDERELELCAGVDSNLTIDSFFEDIIWLFLNAIPLDDGIVDTVNDLQKNEAVL